MNFSFEKEAVQCACNNEINPLQRFNGLLPKQLAKEKNPSMYGKISTQSRPLKQKKVSLKTGKNKGSDYLSKSLRSAEERTSAGSQNGNNINDEYKDFLGKFKPTNQTRQEIEKQKSQIQIQSIGRIPTKQVYKYQTHIKPVPQETIKTATSILQPPQLARERPKQIHQTKPVRDGQIFQKGLMNNRTMAPFKSHEEPPSPTKSKVFGHRHCSSALSAGFCPTKKEQQNPFEKKAIPFTIKQIFPKEIESVVDDEEQWDDQISEVIGHEWILDDEDGFKNGNMPNTIFSMTTNAQNSTINNSYA